MRPLLLMVILLMVWNGQALAEKGRPENRPKCKICAGKGRCKDCSGTGYQNGGRVCTSCGGTAKCYYCSGKGYRYGSCRPLKTAIFWSVNSSSLKPSRAAMAFR